MLDYIRVVAFYTYRDGTFTVALPLRDNLVYMSVHQLNHWMITNGYLLLPASGTIVKLGQTDKVPLPR